MLVFTMASLTTCISSTISYILSDHRTEWHAWNQSVTGEIK